MTVFISRDLSDDSQFQEILTDSGLDVIGQSLIEFTPVPFSKVPDTDWLFFYSRNGAKHFFDQLSPATSFPKLAAIGRSTAIYIRKHYARLCFFVGTGEPRETAQKFLDIANGKSVTFIRAKQSKKSVQEHLYGQIKVKELVVYDNKVKTDIEAPKADIMVFTSPLNVKAFFDLPNAQIASKVVSIGNTTAAALDAQGVKHYAIADEPYEAALAQKVIELA